MTALLHLAAAVYVGGFIAAFMVPATLNRAPRRGMYVEQLCTECEEDHTVPQPVEIPAKMMTVSALFWPLWTTVWSVMSVYWAAERRWT